MNNAQIINNLRDSSKLLSNLVICVSTRSEIQFSISVHNAKLQSKLDLKHTRIKNVTQPRSNRTMKPTNVRTTVDSSGAVAEWRGRAGGSYGLPRATTAVRQRKGAIKSCTALSVRLRV